MASKKKVGILTFSYSSNAGSVMQAYALQKTISSIPGYEASIINYTKTHYSKPIIGKTIFTKNFKTWTPKNMLRWAAAFVMHPIKMRKYERFFKEHYVGFADCPYTRKELPMLNKQYDAFVVGSDQVWNYGSPQVDDTYFLDFVTDNTKKISYAASFGQKDIPEDRRENAKRLISQFTAISVREPTGVEIVSNLTGQQAEWVLDPSLLLEKQDYQNLSIPPKEKGYVLLYLRQPSPRLEGLAKRLAQARGLSVVRIYTHWLCGKNGKPKAPVGPGAWLGYVENADIVVTNSFHGICFSLLFERNFYVDFLNQKGPLTNSRLEGILKQFDLSDRCVETTEDLEELPDIDYTHVNARIALRKEQSLTYLKKALGEGEASQ